VHSSLRTCAGGDARRAAAGTNGRGATRVRVAEDALRRAEEVVRARPEPRDLRRRARRDLEHADEVLVGLVVRVETDRHAQHALAAPVARRRDGHAPRLAALEVVDDAGQRPVLGLRRGGRASGRRAARTRKTPGPRRLDLVDERRVELAELDAVDGDDEVEEGHEAHVRRRRVRLHAEDAVPRRVGLLRARALALRRDARVCVCARDRRACDSARASRTIAFNRCSGRKVDRSRDPVGGTGARRPPPA
jgi:hypothetical protein